MPSVPQRILAILRLGPRDDDELAAQIGVRRQHINQAVHTLEARGRLVRGPGPGGKIVNRLVEAVPSTISSPVAAGQALQSLGTGDAPTSPAASANAAALGGATDWFWEGNVQSRIATYLASTGWQIVRVASTGAKERGDDILARRDGRDLVVEVVGYPSDKYADPRPVSEVNAAQPALQVIQWLADALIHAIRILNSRPGVSVAIGLPWVPPYEKLVAELDDSLRRLGVGVLLVRADGSVDSGLEAEAR